MLLAIIKDENNIKYNIYFDKSNNDFFEVKCFDKSKFYYLDKNNVCNLISNLFLSEKKCISKYREYSVFIDDFNNKHFIRDNYENYAMFFKYNGTSAIMYRATKKDDNNKYPKTFSLKGKNGVSYVLTCSILFFTLSNLYINLFNIVNSDYHNNYFSYIIHSEINEFYNYFDITTIDIINKLKKSNGLTEEEKKYLINESFFDDIINVIEKNRNQELRERLTNVTKVYFTEEELNDKYKKNFTGYYNCLTPNLLHLRDNKVGRDTLSHEFIHLFQDSNKYNFIKEAMAEIISKEYYGEEINSYKEEVKCIKILLELVTPQNVFKCCFSGDTTSFEEEIRNKLNKEDANKLLELLTISPAYCDNIEEIYQELKTLLSKMNGYNIEDNDLFYTILNSPENVYKGYFNDEYIKECEQEETRLIHWIPLKEAINKGLIDIKCELINFQEITEEQFKLLPSDLKVADYVLKEGYLLKDIYIVSEDDKEKYSIKEAMESGLIKDIKFYKRTITDNIPLDDAIKYRNDLNPNYYSHISILGVSEEINLYEMPEYKYKDSDGWQPYVRISYLKDLKEEKIKYI